MSQTTIEMLALAQRLNLYVSPPADGVHFAAGRYGGAGLFLTRDGDRVRRALSPDAAGVLSVLEVSPGLACIVAHGTPDWLTAQDAKDAPPVPEGLHPAPEPKDWSGMSLCDYMGEVTISDQYEVVPDSDDFEPAWSAMQDPSELPEVWRSPDGRVSVRWLDHDDSRDVCAFLDDKPAGVYVRGMAFVHDECRRQGIGVAMVVAGSIISNREPALESDGEVAGLIGYSEAGFLVHEVAFEILQSPAPLLALGQPSPKPEPQDCRPHPDCYAPIPGFSTGPAGSPIVPSTPGF